MARVKMFDGWKDKNFILAGNDRLLDLLILEHMRMMAALEAIEEMDDNTPAVKVKRVATLALGGKS